jgi:LysR family transcriptional regulator, glycine cleavage system transcriptional activator
VVAQRAFVEDDLRAGRLVVEVFDLRASTGNAYYLAYPEHEQASAKTRAFEDWIVSEAAGSG